MNIKGKEYELVDGNCKDCAFLGSMYGGCNLDVGQMEDNESCMGIDNKEKIYKQADDNRNQRSY